jgi:hypothetical protein
LQERGRTAGNLFGAQSGFGNTVKAELLHGADYRRGGDIGKFADKRGRERSEDPFLLLEQLACSGQVVSNVLCPVGADFHAVTAQYTQLRYNGGAGVFNFNRFDGALADALEAVLALRHLGEDGGLRIHPGTLFLQLKLLLEYEFQKIGIDGVENLAVHRDIRAVLAQSFAQMPL